MDKKNFIRYLKEKNIYMSWVRQCAILSGMSKKDIIKLIERYANAPCRIIMCCFSWGETTEGSDFWNGVYNELRDVSYGKKSIDEITL